MAHGICELLWLRLLLTELGFPVTSPMRLYCDNKAAISIAYNPVQPDRTKHIKVDRHFIREKLLTGLICLPFIQTGDQLADIFIKDLGHELFLFLTHKLGLFDVYNLA